VLQAFQAGVLELHTHATPLAVERANGRDDGHRAPQARLGPRVTNLRHEVVTLDAWTASCWPASTGAHDRAALAEALFGARGERAWSCSGTAAP